MLEAKEAISLINGTQAMLAVGTLALLAAETLAIQPMFSAGYPAMLLKAPTLHSMSAFTLLVRMRDKFRRRRISQALEGSAIRDSHRDCGRVQDAYSCAACPKCTERSATRWRTAGTFSKSKPTPVVDNPLVFRSKDKPPMSSRAATSTASRSPLHSISWRSR